MSLVITNPLSNIPKAPKSHNLGYAQIWADQLNAKIDHTCTKNIQNADIVYINHGVNFTGSINLGTQLSSQGETDAFVGSMSQSGTWNWAKSVGGNSYEDSMTADLAQKIFEQTNESLVYAKLHKLTQEDEFLL